MKQFTILLFVFLMMCFSSCEKLFLGEDESNDPINTFEHFWNELDDHYGLFYIRNLDWDSIYSEYKPLVNNETTQEELWEVFSEMIEYLDDSHTRIFNPDTEDSYVSGIELNNIAKEIFDFDLIESKYLDYVNQADGNDHFRYGKLTGKDIGYMHIARMAGFDSTRIDLVLDSLEKHKAIVIDIRGNRGGFDETAIRISSRFSDGEHFVFTNQTRNGPEHFDFDEPTKHYTSITGESQFRKPVVLLTDRATISAGEEFIFFMKTFEDVAQIGDYTAGDMSDVSTIQFLPNGWFYVFSHQMYLTPEGESIDGIGHKPDVLKVNKQEDVEAGNDLVIESAIQYLFDTYMIE